MSPEINYLFEVGLDSLANYLYSKNPFPEEYLDWENQKKITFFKCPSPRKQREIFEEEPYDKKIERLGAKLELYLRLE